MKNQFNNITINKLDFEITESINIANFRICMELNGRINYPLRLATHIKDNAASGDL